MAATATASPFVGREAELGRLQAAFELASDGPVTLCVGGEAGVGKTRLITRFLDHVQQSGGQVLLGGCIELGEGSLPYAPVVQALRVLQHGLDPATSDQLLGAGRPLLARLLPELGPSEQPEPAGPMVGFATQARLFESCLALLERLTEQYRTVFVVEDLHWADRSSLDLLTFLVRNLRAPVLLVLTYRTDDLHRRHPLRPFLAELDRNDRAERLDVDRFDRVDMSNLLSASLDRPLAPDLVERIFQRSEGNAFFAEELLAAVRQGNSPTHLPPGLENVLLSRIQVLPEETQATLRILAAAGGPVEHDVLAAVSDLPESDLLAALRAAVTHQVLVTDPVAETYAFRHALAQEAVYADLLPGERARLHADLARTLTERPDLADASYGATAARLAYHWIRAHDPAQALPAAVQAGLQSEAAYAFADAQRHFETALELWDQVADSSARLELDRVDILRHAAESAYLAGDPRRAITATRAALAALEQSGDSSRSPVRAGLLHALLADYLNATGGEGAIGEYERAVRLVPAQPPRAERAQVLAALGEALVRQGRYRESRGLCEEAIAIASQLGARGEEGDARRALGVDLAFLGDLPAGVRELTEARRIGEVFGKVNDVARGFATLSGLLDAFGELEAAVEVALEGAELAASRGLGRWHSPFLTATAGRALFALGRWDEADDLLGRVAQQVAPELAATRVYIFSARAELASARGCADQATSDLAAAREAYDQTVRQPWFASPLFAATAELALLQGRVADAQEAVTEGLRVAGGDLIFGVPLCVLGVRAAADRAELGRARRGNEEVARAIEAGDELSRDLASQISPLVGDGPVPTPRTRAYALLCDAEFSRLNPRSNPDRWGAVATAWEQLGEPYRCAYARWREAEAQLLSGRGRQQVESLLKTAYATANRLGAAPLRAEIEALARRGRLELVTEKAKPEKTESSSPLASVGLTAREQEVLTLLASGRTNRQIAQTLFISPKTATVHVSRIFAKLGVSNRVEAATILHRLNGPSAS